jgi:hypothetical protein
MINFLKSEQVTSQQKDLTSRHNYVTGRHNYLTSRHNYLTSREQKYARWDPGNIKPAEAGEF